MKSLLAVLLFPMLGAAAILPDTLGAYQKSASSRPSLSDRAVWNEYGLKSSEAASYRSGRKSLSVEAYELQDPTAALAAFYWLRPADAKISQAAQLAAETPNSLVAAFGNYVLSFRGYVPTKEELASVKDSLRNLDTSSLPTLPGYLPSENLTPNSERYILGPASLEKFVPGVPPSVAAFSMGAEGETALFRSPKGDLRLGLFSYPTPQIAMDRVTQFQKLPQALAKRSGLLVAVIVSPADPDAAEHILSQVRYQAAITRDEYVPSQRDNIGNLVINAFVLIGILLAFALASGIVVGGIRAMRRSEGEPMIILHLEQR